MARQTAINTADDMRWLREVHLPRLPAKYKSAIIVGNEDYPDRIEVYERRNPVVTDVPLVFEADGEGVFRATKQPSTKRHHATKKTKKSPAQLQREINKALASTRRYHVVVINERTGKKGYMTATPVTHREGTTILKKITDYPWRRKQLEEVA